MRGKPWARSKGDYKPIEPLSRGANKQWLTNSRITQYYQLNIETNTTRSHCYPVSLT